MPTPSVNATYAKNADKVLELLYERGEAFFLADDLAAAATLTPQRLNEALELLRQRGHDLDFSPAQGLRLRRPIALDSHLIERGLGIRRLGKHVIVFNEVDSTNDVAFDSARQPDADGLVVLANSQRRGRGRQGRTWLSPPGANVLMSALLIDPQNKLAHEPLTIATGLAVAQSLEQACGIETQLKWPNDVMIDGAKVAGVLVEVRSIDHRPCVVIGIGINVNAHPPAGQTDWASTSLAEHAPGPLERLTVVRCLLEKLDYWVARLDDVADMRKQWIRRCGMINQRVTVVSAGREHAGRVLDVSPLEGLVLMCDSGQRVHLPAVNSSVLK